MSRIKVGKDDQNLLTSGDVGFAYVLEGKNSNVDKCLMEQLPIIRCDCGAEILVVPDLQAMNRAIKTHVAWHRKERNSVKGVLASGKVSKLLSQRTLLKMGEQNDT
jgi:hypothetical protein